MANKEEVIFKVKAELEGFRKSMDELKKMAKESSKNIEKSMNLNLTDEGKKAGQTFAKGFNKEIKNLTDSLEKELKTMANQTYNVKIKLDSSSIEQVKKELSDIEITVSASASSRASSSMSNNANAPNSASTIASMANAAVSSNIASEVKKAVDLITSAISKIDIAKIGVDTKDAKIGVDTDGVKVGIDSEGVKVGVDAQDVKVGVNTEGVKVGVDTQNIQDIKVGVDTKDAKVGVETKDAKVGVDVKNAKVGVDTYDTKVGVDTRGAKVGVDTKNVKVDVNAKDIKIDAKDIKVGVDVEGAKVGVDTEDVQISIDKESVPEIELKAPEIKPIEINIESIKTVNDIITSAFKDGSEIIGTEIYNAFSKSAQELYGDIVELYKVIAQKISEANKSQNNNTTTSTKHKSNTLDDVKFGSYSWAEQERIKQRSPFEAPNERNPFVKTGDLGNKYALFEIDKIKNADKAFQDIQNTISDVSKSMKEMLKEFSESIKQISNIIKNAFANNKDGQKAKEDSAYARRKNRSNSFSDLNELEKINKQIEQWKNRLSSLNDKLKKETDSNKIAQYESSMAKIGAKLGELNAKLKELERLDGFNELCMTLEEADGAVTKLRMNLQLLSDDSESSDNYVDKLRKEIDDIHEQISKLIDYRFKVFDKECEEKIRNSFNNLSDAVEQGARAIEAIIQKYGSNPIGEGKFDKESHSQVYSARENLKEKYKDFKDVTSPPHMGYYIDKDFEQETDNTVQNALKALNDKMNALEKSPSLIHADTVGESAIKLIEKFNSIIGDEEFTAKYKNRTTFNKLLDSIEKNMDDISEDDIPKHLEEDWKNVREAIGYIRKNKDAVFKPMADDVFKEQKDKIDQMKVDIDDSYGSEAIRKGLNDTLRKLEDKLDKERRISKSKETVDEFDREIIKPLESEINKSSASSNVKQDYSQAINGIVERMKRAFDKATPKDIILEFEAAFKQLEDRMNNAPVGKVTEDNIKHIINRMREQIENAYEASNLDLEINLPVRSSLDVPAVINSIKEQMEDVEQYVENNVNLPIRSSLDVPDIRRNLDVIEVEFREVGEAAESFRDKIKSVFAVFGQKNSHVATHMVGEFNNKLNKLKENAKKVSASIKDIGTPFKKAFSGLSGIINKIISPIKKVTSGFKGMGNEAKVASSKVNGLTGSFKGLLGKLTMYFGIYEIFNLFKTGTQDAMKYEATVMNLQRTFGKASQSLIDFANTNAVAFGLSKRQVAEYGNIYSAIMRDVNMAMAKPGDTADDIAKKTMGMSEELLKSAGIISSALGYDMEYVLEGLRSGLLGSSQAVDQFGLNLKRANLESSQAFKEVANGAESWEKLTVAQQQYVITQEIINQTTSKFGSILDRNGKIMQSTASLHSQFLAQLANTKLAVGNLGKVIWTAILPPLTKILAVLEVVFNYAASAMTALLKMFNIKVDLNANLGGTDKLNESLNNLGDSTSTTDELGDSLNNVGDSAQDTAKDTEDAAKKIKRALAGFDQINVLTLGEDAENEEPEFEGFDPNNWNPTPVDPGDFGVQLPDLGNEFEAKLDKLKNIFKEIMEPLKAAWDLLGDRWIAAWDRLKASFKNFCDALSDFLVSVWNNGGKEFVQHMAEIALAVGIAAMEIGGTILDSLAKLWKHLDPSTNINTKGLLDALNEVSVKIRDLLLDLNGHFESLMNNGGQDVLNALGDMFMNLGEAAVRGVGIVIDAIDGLLDHLDPATNKKTQGALGGLEYLFKSIGQFALGLTDAFATFMDNGGQDFLNNMGDILMILIDMAATITGDLLNAITAFFDSWAGHVVITVAGRALELVSSILKGLLEILEPLTPIISGVVAAIGAFMVASKITTAVTTIVSAFQNLGPILGIAKAGFSALWAVLAANPVAALVAAIVGIGVALVALYNKCEGFRDIVNAIFDGLREPLEKLKETFSEIIESIVNIFQDCIDIIVGIFTGDGERVGKAVRDMIENVLNIFKNIFKFKQQMAELGLNLILGLVEGIWECIKNLPQLLAGVAEFIFDFFVGLFGLSPETVEKIKQSGRDMVDSLCQGVMDAISAIGDFFGAIGDAIKQGIDNITSAEWWSDLGKAIAQPFIDAKDFIVELLGDIGSSISEWFSNKIDEALETLGKIKDFLSDIGKSAKEALNALREWASGLPEAIGNALSNLKTSIVEGPIGDLVRAIGDKLGEIKDVASERFEIATKNASEKWGELTEELSGMLDDFIERNKERWERIKQDTAEKVRPIVDETVEKYTEMKDSVSTKLDELMVISEERWGEIKEKIINALSPIIDYYKNQIEYVKKMTADIADATVQVLGEIWNNATGVLKAAWENMSDFAIEKSDYIKTMVSDIAEATSEVLNEIWSNTTGVLQAAWENMSNLAIDIFEYTKTMVSDITDATNEVLGEIWNNTTGVLEAAWENMSLLAMGVFDYIRTMVSDIAEATNEVLSEIWSNTTGVLEAAWEGMSEFAIGVFDYIKTMVCDIAEATNEVLGEIWSVTTGVLSAAWDGMSEFAIGAFDYIKTMVSDISEATVEVLSEIWNNATGVLGAAWDNFSETCVGVFEYIKTMASDITDATIEVISTIWNNTTGVLGAAWDNFSQTCIGVFDYIKTMVSDITEATVEVLGEIWGNVTGVLGAAWDGITDLVGDWVKGICDTIFDGFIVLPAMMKDLFNVDAFGFIKDALDKGLDLLKGAGGIGEKAIAIGRFIIEGLIDGISTGVKAIGTFISGVCDIIIGFFKDLFGIHSPSTVFAELGGFLMEGLMQGIENLVPSLEGIFNGVSDAISGAWERVENAWSGASDFFSGIGETVKGVLDTIKNTSIPKPKIEWDSVKESASKIVDNIKTTVQRFKADLPKPKVSWNDLTTSLSKILDNLRRTISNFKWELPKPKLPKFSVTGGQAPWGFMGKGSMPKIDIKWFKTGGIMTSATLFGMSGNTLLGGGEAGAEAILPLDELWSRLDNHFNQQNALLRSTVANSNGNNSNRPVNIVLKVNDIEMGKAVVSSLKALSNHSGTLDLPLK